MLLLKVLWELRDHLISYMLFFDTDPSYRIMVHDKALQFAEALIGHDLWGFMIPYAYLTSIMFAFMPLVCYLHSQVGKFDNLIIKFTIQSILKMFIVIPIARLLDIALLGIGIIYNPDIEMYIKWISQYK